tara:strand:+ start:353 stop:520 length:168 start_codon:yes stop_codon:yes gene_type:complete
MPKGPGTYGSKKGRPPKKTVRKVKRVQKLVEKGKMKKATRVAARYDRKRKKKGNK